MICFEAGEENWCRLERCSGEGDGEYGDGQYPHAVGEAHFSEYVKTGYSGFARLQNEIPHCEKFVPREQCLKMLHLKGEYRLGVSTKPAGRTFVVDPEDEKTGSILTIRRCPVLNLYCCGCSAENR